MSSFYRVREFTKDIKNKQGEVLLTIHCWYAQYTRDERGRYWTTYKTRDGLAAFTTREEATAYIVKRLGGHDAAIRKCGGSWTDETLTPFIEVMTIERYNTLSEITRREQR